MLLLEAAGLGANLHHGEVRRIIDEQCRVLDAVERLVDLGPVFSGNAATAHIG